MRNFWRQLPVESPEMRRRRMCALAQELLKGVSTNPAYVPHPGINVDELPRPPDDHTCAIHAQAFLSKVAQSGAALRSRAAIVIQRAAGAWLWRPTGRLAARDGQAALAGLFGDAASGDGDDLGRPSPTTAESIQKFDGMREVMTRTFHGSYRPIAFLNVNHLQHLKRNHYLSEDLEKEIDKWRDDAMQAVRN